MSLVTVIVHTFNHETYIDQCLDSILNQSAVHLLKIVIIDDASSDRTQTKILSYQEAFPEIISSILLTKNQRSIGRVPGLDFYLKCESSFLAFCDGDDYWMDRYKIEKQLKLISNNEEVGVVHSDYKICINDGNMWTLKDRSDSEKIKAKNKTNRHDFYMGNNIKASTVIIRKDGVNWSFIEKSQHIVAIDWLIYLSVSERYRIVYLEEATTAHRVTENGLWNGQDTKTKELMKSEIRWHCAANLPEGPTRKFFRNAIVKDHIRLIVSHSLAYKVARPFFIYFRKINSRIKALI